ncbi:MAG TPA: DNA-binding protein WhiA [Candidatus Limnocylindria bacterium]|nr:DNA-binding protein WhiA [Candidatus Limnocylindria bacterium]
MTRGVPARERSPLSDEVKAELARLPLKACDARVLAALLPRAGHLALPARRLARRTVDVDPRSLYRRSCCRRAYLRGLLLSGGSVSAGASGYLLELRPPRGEVRRAASVLGREGFAPAIRSRRGQLVFTIRDAELIAAYLRACGASETLLRFEAMRVSREVRGRTNALVNAESANLARTVASARAQTEAIRLLARAGRLTSLPAPVREAARARLGAPTATLSDLARRLDTTKWAVRSRLRRLVEEAEA